MAIVNRTRRANERAQREDQEHYSTAPEAPSLTGERPGKEEEEVRFDPGLLPHSVATWAVDVAERMDGAPVVFAGTSALAALSAAIGRRVGVRPKLHDIWTVVPNLWGMLIAPPSVKKTPIYSEMFKPLVKAEIEEGKAYEEALREYDAEMLVYEAEMKAYKKKLEKGEREKSLPSRPEAPIKKRYLISDATVEKVAEIMIDNPHGLALVMDELSGFFSTLSKAGREGDRSFYLEAYNGDGGKNIDRIQRGSFYVPHVCASIFGTIQPDVIFNLVAAENSGGSGGDGLLQRFQLLAIVERSNFTPTDRAPNLTARDKYEELMHRLLYADPLEYGATEDLREKKDMPFYRFSTEANAVFNEWRTKLNKRKIEEEANPSFSSHLGKLESLFASLALILFYSDRVMGLTDKNEVPEDYARRALKLCSFFEGQARKLYDMERIKERREEAMDEKIIAKARELEDNGKLPMSRGDLSRHIRGARAEDVKRALKGLARYEGKKILSVRRASNVE